VLPLQEFNSSERERLSLGITDLFSLVPLPVYYIQFPQAHNHPLVVRQIAGQIQHKRHHLRVDLVEVLGHRSDASVHPVHHKWGLQHKRVLCGGTEINGGLEVR